MNDPANRPTMMVVTPQIAQNWLETMHYDEQRKMRQVHVDKMAADMKKGKFTSGTMIRIAILNGKRYLIDGQHRLWAIVLAETSVEFVVLETTVSSEQEIAWLYGNTDTGLRRNSADLFGPLHLAEEFGVTRSDVSAMSAAVVFMASGCRRYGGNGNRVLRDDQIRYMRTYAPQARQYFALIEGCNSARLRNTAVRAPTLAVALLTLRFALPLAETRHARSVTEFWRGAVFDDGIAIGDPRKHAFRHLVEARLIKGGQSSSGSISVSPAYSARYLAGCFNAYMEEREIRYVRIGDDQQALKLYGAPSEPALWW